jgi:hypothetical protein
MLDPFAIVKRLVADDPEGLKAVLAIEVNRPTEGVMIGKRPGEFALFPDYRDDASVQENLEGVKAMVCLPHGIAVGKQNNPRHAHAHQQVHPVGGLVEPISVVPKGLKVHAPIGDWPTTNFFWNN